MEENEEEQLRDRIDKAAEELGEHVDSVQIIITYHRGDRGESASYSNGKGCFYARMGAVKEWVIRQDQYTKTDADISQREG